MENPNLILQKLCLKQYPRLRVLLCSGLSCQSLREMSCAAQTVPNRPALLSVCFVCFCDVIPLFCFVLLSCLALTTAGLLLYCGVLVAFFHPLDIRVCLSYFVFVC